MKFLLIKLSGCFLGIALFISSASVMGQSQQELLPLDESQFTDTAKGAPAPPTHANTAPARQVESEESSDFGGEATTQNAIIEGIQLSSEPGDKSEEKIISCYFIFRDKPSSYFYEVKAKDKKIIFEFNDTKTGSAPIPSTAEAPIKGFTTEQRKIDINKEVKGLKPEYHNQVRVSFQMEAVPEIHVVDEYNVISFSYKWSDNPGKASNYVVKNDSKKVIIWSAAGVAGIGAGVLGYYIYTKPKPKPPIGDIPIDDLPGHPSTP
jgi:hypothetical protein